MERLEASEPDSLNSCHVSPFQAGKRRAREEDEVEPIEQERRMKFGGIAISNIEIPNEKKIESFMHHNEEDITSKITKPTALIPSTELVTFPLDLHSPRADSTVLNLNSPADIASNSFHQPCLPPKHENTNKADLLVLGVDLNDPFYPYKKLGQVRSTAASECGSTTSSLEISESMRKWNEMKQNGFVSTVQVKASIPRLKKCQSRKRKDELKKIIHITKQEQLNKKNNVTDPSQFLSGLNPGIIKHVRNSKQVNSIIKAMLQNEMLQKQNRHIGPLKRGSKEAVNKPLIPSYYNSTSEFNSECDDDALTLKLSCSGTTAPKPEDITSLSIKAANVALQWLTLIGQDIIARLAAIQRSKKRVKNAIEMELPHLFSRDLHSKQENELLFGHSLTRCSQKEIFNVHLARWKAVFTQMEVSLTDEENQLEKWLRQVEELKSQCQEGLRYVNTNGFLHFEVANEIRILKSQEALDKELAVRAAAASIYSTCNMIMTAENVPCF
ncbi:hypothetical protein KFK09_003153 [Dendrobium nobile]|uniref:Uncharacterized protein n=1 Tax=Dendrobium nobile TaxID=94219 RepID=A0A8T3C5X5_DENNO|nr:hypothetical protein KFK09_003153 [Dendrobium nobile]